MCLAVQTIQGPPDEKKEREKEKAQDNPEGPQRAFCGVIKRKILNGGKKKTQFGVPKERKARRACRKGNDGFHKGGFRPYQPYNGTGKDFHQHKGRGKDQKGEGEERTVPQSGLSASETLNEEGYGQAWESGDWSSSHWTDDSWTPDAGWFCTKAHSAWMVATPLNLANYRTHVVLDLGCTRSIGSRAAIDRLKKHAWYYGITTEFCRCTESFVALSTFQQFHHVIPRLMYLRQAMCPSCFPSLR